MRIRQTFKMVLWSLGLVAMSQLVLAQSLWLETGLAYTEQLNDSEANQTFEPYAKLSVKAILPVNETLSVYLNPYWQGGFGFDAGAWIDFPGRIQDLENFDSFAALGLSYLPLLNLSSETGFGQTGAAFGLALVGGISYSLSDTLSLSLSYTHHPILSPSLAQAFDISLGLRINLSEP